MKIKLILTTVLFCGLFSSLSWAANTSIYFSNNTADSTCNNPTLQYTGTTTNDSKKVVQV